MPTKQLKFYVQRCAGHCVFAVLCLTVLQRGSCQDARISSTINDQIESLRLAQSYTNVTGLLNEVVATATSGKNQVLGIGFSGHHQRHGLSQHIEKCLHFLKVPSAFRKLINCATLVSCFARTFTYQCVLTET